MASPLNIEGLLPHWFSLHSVNQREVRALPGIFSGNTHEEQQAYKDARDFMVRAYLADPNKRLTFTACRSFIRLSANTLMILHNYLDQQKIINFAVVSVKSDEKELGKVIEVEKPLLQKETDKEANKGAGARAGAGAGTKCQ